MQLSANFSTLTDEEVSAMPVAELTFIGELIDAEGESLVDGFTDAERPEFGGPDSDLLVGPAVLTLASQQAVTVDANTPGRYACNVINPDHNGPRITEGESRCLTLGATDPEGSRATWFTTMDTTYDGAGLQVGSAIGLAGDDVVLVLPGSYTYLIRLPLPENATFACTDGTATVDHNGLSFPEAAGYNVAIEPTTGQVSGFTCFDTD